MKPGANGCAHRHPFGGSCDGCAAFVQRMLAQFAADVIAGTHDAQGYTIEERAAKERRRQIDLFSESGA